MKVKSKFFSKSVKLGFALLTICGGLLTSCYEKEELDVPTPTPTDPEAPVYIVKGTVSDYDSNSLITADKITLSGVSPEQKGSSFEFTLDKAGSYILSVEKAGYTTVKMTVDVNQIETGKSVTNLGVMMRPSTTPPSLIEAKYKILGAVTDAIEGTPIATGEIKIDNQTKTITNGFYPAFDVTSGSHAVTISASGYKPFVTMVYINKVMDEEQITVEHSIPFELTPVESQNPDETYPVLATSDEAGVQFTLTGRTAKGNPVSDSGSSINGNYEAGTYILKAEAAGFDAQSTEFILGPNDQQGFVWNVKFEQEPQQYNVETFLRVVVLDNETGENITSSVEILVNGNTITSDGFATVVGVNIVDVTDNTDTYYGTTYLVNVDKTTSDVQGEKRIIGVEVKLNKKPLPPVDVYTIKATSADTSVLLTLYKGDNVIEASLGSLIYTTEESGEYRMEATKEGKIIIPVVFTVDANAPNYVWSLTHHDIKDIQSGDILFIPGREYNGTIENNNTEGMVSAISVRVPGDALDRPTVINIQTINHEYSADAHPTTPSLSIITFEGVEDGLQFNTPIEISFADNYGLGDLNLYFLNNNNEWKIEPDPVISSGGTYLAKVPHFCKFKVGLDCTSSFAADQDIVQTGSGNIYNPEAASKDINLKYNTKVGVKMLSDWDTVLNGVSSLLPNGKELLKVALENIIYAHTGSKPLTDFTSTEETRAVTIPGLSVLTSATATQSFEKQTYGVILNGITVSVEVLVAGSTVLVEQISPISHGHGHGGNNWNSGGGISYSE